MGVATNDPDVAILIGLAGMLQAQYMRPDIERRWAGSPFAWIRSQPSRRVGKIGEQLVSGWCAAKGLDVTSTGDSEADRVINHRRTEISSRRCGRAARIPFSRSGIRPTTMWCAWASRPMRLTAGPYRKPSCVGISRPSTAAGVAGTRPGSQSIPTSPRRGFSRTGGRWHKRFALSPRGRFGGGTRAICAPQWALVVAAASPPSAHPPHDRKPPRHLEAGALIQARRQAVRLGPQKPRPPAAGLRHRRQGIRQQRRRDSPSALGRINAEGAEAVRRVVIGAPHGKAHHLAAADSQPDPLRRDLRVDRPPERLRPVGREDARHHLQRRNDQAGADLGQRDSAVGVTGGGTSPTGRDMATTSSTAVKPACRSSRIAATWAATSGPGRK